MNSYLICHKIALCFWLGQIVVGLHFKPALIHNECLNCPDYPLEVELAFRFDVLPFLFRTLTAGLVHSKNPLLHVTSHTVA